MLSNQFHDGCLRNMHASFGYDMHGILSGAKKISILVNAVYCK